MNQTTRSYGARISTRGPTPKPESHSLSAVHDLLFDTFTDTRHTWWPSPPVAVCGRNMPSDVDQRNPLAACRPAKTFLRMAAFRSPQCEKHGGALPMDTCNTELQMYSKWKENKYGQDQVSKGPQPVLWRTRRDKGNCWYVGWEKSEWFFDVTLTTAGLCLNVTSWGLVEKFWCSSRVVKIAVILFV